MQWKGKTINDHGPINSPDLNTQCQDLLFIAELAKFIVRIVVLSCSNRQGVILNYI